MFTGIIEALGKVKDIQKDGANLDFTIESNLTSSLKIDQSLCHNGVCLTVVGINAETEHYQVTAVEETLIKSNLGMLNVGDNVNLERSMQMNGRLDGHIVQGHVDQMAVCIQKEDHDGSWIFSFEYDPSLKNMTVEKGSICVNGVSLTVVDSRTGKFSVAIIPYTYHHTNFASLNVDQQVNLEFDILGKYVQRYLSQLNN